MIYGRKPEITLFFARAKPVGRISYVRIRPPGNGNIPIRQTKNIPLPPVFPYTPSPIILMHMARHMPGCFRTRKKTQEKRISSIYRVQRKRNTRCSAGKDEKLPGQGKGQYLRKPGRKEREKGYEKTEYCRKKGLYPDTG